VKLTVVVLLVGLVVAVGVANLCLQVSGLALDVVPDTRKVCPLHVSVEVDLDDTVLDSLAEVVNGATRATVEDQEDRLVVLGADLLLGV
jgi:hypothetical protein